MNILDGKYKAAILDVSFGQSKAGNNMVIWSLSIINDQYPETRIKKFNVITNDKSRHFLRWDINKCGGESKEYRGLSSEDFDNYLKKFIGIIMNIEIISSGKYKNIRFIKKDDEQENIIGSNSNNDEKIPF